jgi:hypothetical protein
MHALVITFTSATPPERLAEPLAAYARALGGVPGHAATTWLRDGATLGAFHRFASRRAAEAYLAGELVAGLTANPAFTRFRVAHYAVLDDPATPRGDTQRIAP